MTSKEQLQQELKEKRELLANERELANMKTELAAIRAARKQLKGPGVIGRVMESPLGKQFMTWWAKPNAKKH